MPTLQDVLDELLGAGETALTLGTGAASGVAGMPYGLYKGLTSGKYLEGKAADIASKEAARFMDRNTYLPRTRTGQENLSAIAKIMEASKLPPVIPEAVMLSSIPRAAAAAQAERLGMSAEKALEAPVRRAYEKGGLSREMLLAMGQGTQSQAREAKVAGIPIRELLYPNRGDLTPAEKSAVTRFEKSLAVPAVRRREEMRATGGDIITPTAGLKMIPEMEINPRDLIDKRLVPVFGDLSPVGGDVSQVAGVPLSKPVVQQGGRRYASIQPNVDQGIAYASEPSQALGKIANFGKFPDEDVLGVFFGGGPESVNFSHHMAQSFVRQLDALKPSKDAVKQFNQAIKESFVDVNDPLTGKKVRKYPFTNFAGIDSPNIDELMTVKGAADYTPGQLRTAISEAVSKAKFRDMGFPVYGDTQKVMTEQGLTPGYAGQLIFRPTQGQSIVKPDYTHSSYSAGMPGQILGGVNVVNKPRTGVPANLLFPELFERQQAKGARYDQILAKMRMSHQGEKFTEKHFDALMDYMEK
jgi:hypothetical protein